MFENFTFAAQAQSSCQHVESESTSPTNISFPSPTILPPEWDTTNQSGVDSIAQQFAIQSLSSSSHLDNEESQKSLWNNNVPSPIIDFDTDSNDPFTSEDLSYVSTTRGMTRVQADFSTSRDTLADRRLQRQRNVQLQSNSNYVRDIKTLVSGMIENNSQCKLRKSTSRPCLHSPPPSRGGEREGDRERQMGLGDREVSGSNMDLDILCSFDRAITPDIEDEGFGDDDELIAAMKEEVASLRRTSTPSGIRKNVRRYRSSETLGGGLGSSVGRDTKVVDGKVKVRCLPRMRKRNKVLSPGVVPE